jgi:hypothetical protein
MIINYDCTVITIANYDHKTFILQATEVSSFTIKKSRLRYVKQQNVLPFECLKCLFSGGHDWDDAEVHLLAVPQADRRSVLFRTSPLRR